MKKKYAFEAMHTDYGHFYGVHTFLDATLNFKKYNELRGRTFKAKGYMK